MFLTYKNAVERRTITPHYTSPKSMLVSHLEETDIVTSLIKQAVTKQAHDLSVIFFLSEITEEREAILIKIIKSGIPVTAFTLTQIIPEKLKRNDLFKIIKISESAYSEFKEGPLAVYNINEDVHIIYPEDSLQTSFSAVARNCHMVQLIEPLCNQHGVDFPLGDVTFRLLRHSVYYEQTQQWNKILYLGKIFSDVGSSYDPKICLIIAQAKLALSQYEEASQNAELISNYAKRIGAYELKCQADYLIAASEWRATHANIIQKLLDARSIYYDNDLDNELLLARINALLILTVLKHPPVLRTAPKDEVYREAALAFKIFKECDSTFEFDHFSIELATHYLQENTRDYDPVRAEHYLNRVSAATRQGDSSCSTKFASVYAIIQDLNTKDDEALKTERILSNSN